MGKNIKGLAGSTIFNQKMVEQMNGINKNNKQIPLMTHAL